MCHRTLTLVFPCEHSSEPRVQISRSAVSVAEAGASIYDNVEFFERRMFPGKSMAIERITDRIPLRDVVNLHNDTGIRDFRQITCMIRQIRSGRDILHPSELPNMKLVRAADGGHVLFDGHHSMLACMAAGREFLDEVPHLIVHGAEGFVTDQEILVFFGAYSRELKASDWKQYVINWQAPRGKQLCGRVQKNMGELFDALAVVGTFAL